MNTIRAGLILACWMIASTMDYHDEVLAGNQSQVAHSIHRF